MKVLSPTLFAIFIFTSAACFISGVAHAQSLPYIQNGTNLISCQPAPCVLPPTQASEGGYEVADAPIIADPLNPAHLLLGSMDFNCQYGLGFFSSSDGGSNWNRTCLTQFIGLNGPSGEPMVGYDRKGVGGLHRSGLRSLRLQHRACGHPEFDRWNQLEQTGQRLTRGEISL